MKVKLSAGAVLALVGLAVGGFVVWRGVKAGASVAQGVKDLWAAGEQQLVQAGANVTSAWNNNVRQPFIDGQNYMEGINPYRGEKAWLYSDYGYTGNDASGTPIIEGEWYGDAVARRYDAEQRANGTPPAATSINGAAFGIYPKP